MVFASLKDKLECARRTNKILAESAIPATPENAKILNNLSEINKESSQIYDSNRKYSLDASYIND